MPRYRSFSQWSQYNRCPHAYYLSRIQRVWRKPAAWSPMGTAVHEAVELWERSDRIMTVEQAQAAFRESYRKEIDQLLTVTPNTKYWFASGPYDAEVDIPRRMEIGQQHVANYIGWYLKHPSEVPWTLRDGRLALELPFTVQLGTVEVRGLIDWIGRLAGKLQPRDNKTGRKPGQVEQLKLYGVAIEDHEEFHGEPIEVEAGDFFMTKSGKPTFSYDLTEVSRDELVVEYEHVDALIQAGDFPPKPDPDVCWSCEVRDSCKYRAC
jgi:putative RecB family exonuclease